MAFGGQVITPAAQETQSWRLTPERLVWLIVAMALVLAPHAARVPAWVMAGFGLFAACRFVALRRGVIPARWMVALLTLVMLPGVYLSYGTLLGRSSGVALLTILAGMKLLETRALRDAYIVIFLGYFLVITNFLFSQSILTGLYMFLVVVVLTASMIGLCTRDDVLERRARLKLSGQMLVQAIPIMLLLFVLFPRISGPIWGLPKDAHSARSGLSNTMSPGQISDLSLSDAVAFRVKFEGRRPGPRDLYWRGPVLWRTDGTTWRTRRSGRSIRPMYAEIQGEPLDYQVTLEPHNQRWLFALDVPTTVPQNGQMTEDFEILSVSRVRERRRYPVRSYSQYVMRRLSLEQRELALELPPDAHPKAKALGREWRMNLRDPGAVVERALQYFNQQAFYYTLQPPLLAGDTVDGFLFGTQRGFCEHYSAAFAVLMRAAGVPARVVTGYQGGEFNALGDYLVVRQRDAHAWVEVWLKARGWTRVDPTAAVSPDRIERGMDAVIPPTIGPRSLGFEPGDSVHSAWRWLRQGVDAINNGWNQWVLGYGPKRQRELLERLGLDPERYLGVAFALAAGIGTVMLLVAVWLARRRPPVDRAAKLYARFCTVLARKGVVRRASEGPLDFANRVGRTHPSWAVSVDAVTELYVAVRYGHRPQALPELAQAVRQIKL